MNGSRFTRGGGRRRGIAPGINLTPLLDTTLNLIFFFLLVTTVRREEFAAEVKLPSSDTATQAPLQAESISLGADGRIVFRGRPIGEDELELELTQLARQGTKEITIRADKDLILDRFTHVTDICRRTGIKTVQIQTQRGGGGRP